MEYNLQFIADAVLDKPKKFMNLWLNLCRRMMALTEKDLQGIEMAIMRREPHGRLAWERCLEIRKLLLRSTDEAEKKKLIKEEMSISQIYEFPARLFHRKEGEVCAKSIQGLD